MTIGRDPRCEDLLVEMRLRPDAKYFNTQLTDDHNQYHPLYAPEAARQAAEVAMGGRVVTCPPPSIPSARAQPQL